MMKQKICAGVAVLLLATGLSVSLAGPAQAVVCTAQLGQNCGPYSYPQIPMSNGFNTYVQNQSVGPQSGTTQTVTATDPGNWSVTANDVPYGYTGVQTFPAVQQLTNDWNGNGWGGATANTPLSALSALSVSYSETSPSNANSIYEYAPDVWNDNYTSDVMFWVDTSPVRCTNNGLSSADILGQYASGGQNWTVYRYGGVGSEIIIILDGTGSTDPVTTGTCARQPSGTINILAGFQWLASHGIMTGLGALSQLNTGWEITSADNTTFTVTSYSVSATVGSQQQAPAVTTDSATGITTGGATLNGTVNPNGQATTYQYQFGTTTSYGTLVPATPASAGSGTTAVSEPQNVTGLSPGTTYHYRLTATNATGTTNGADRTFTTPAQAQAPSVTTGAASGVTSSAATLNGTVNPNGSSTTYQFQYGIDIGYGSNTPVPAGSAGSGAVAVNESASITGLSPATTYHYRLTATNAQGTTYGADQSFTTTSAVSLLAGDSTIEPATDSNPQGTAQAYQYVASRSGTTQTVSFYVDSANTATAGRLGIYSNSGISPGTLLKQVTFTPVTGWNTVTFTNVTITSGTTYWFAELGTSGVLAYRDQGSGGPASETISGLTVLPASWSGGYRWNSGSASFYVSG